MLTKIVHRFNTTPIKIPIVFFIEMEEIILQFVWNPKKPPVAKAMLRNENKPGSITLPVVYIVILIHSLQLYKSIIQSYNNQQCMVLMQNQQTEQKGQK